MMRNKLQIVMKMPEKISLKQHRAQLNARDEEIQILQGLLLEAVNHACQAEFVDGICIVQDSGLPVYGNAIDYLEKNGLARRFPGRFTRWELLWENLPLSPLERMLSKIRRSEQAR